MYTLKKVFVICLLVSSTTSNALTKAYGNENKPGQIKKINLPVKNVDLYQNLAEVSKRKLFNSTGEENYFILLPKKINTSSIALLFGNDSIPFSVKYYVSKNYEEDIKKEITSLMDKKEYLTISKNANERRIKILQDIYDKNILTPYIKKQGYEKDKSHPDYNYHKKRKYAPDVVSTISGSEAVTKKIIEVSEKIYQIEKNIKEIDEKIADINKKIRSGNEFGLHFTLPKGEEILTLNYMTSAAGWKSSYKASLNQKEDTLKLTSSAIIWQDTGNNWDNSQITLHTDFSPKVIINPIKKPWVVDLAIYPILQNSGLSTFEKASNMRKASNDVVTMSESFEVITKPKRSIINGLNETYIINNPVSIASGNTKIVSLYNTTDKVKVSNWFIPQQDKNFIHMMVNYENKTGKTLLPGELSIYRDNSFIRKENIKVLLKDSFVWLDFGVKKGVKAEFIKAPTKEQSDNNLISDDETIINKKELITLENISNKRVEIDVFYKMPVSKNENLVIKTKRKMTKPDKKDTNNIEGLLLFKVDLDPNKEEQLNIDYDLIYPKDKNYNIIGL